MNIHNHNSAHEIQEMAQGYLKRKLTPEEQVEFEEHLMENPDLLQDMQVDNLFVSTMQEAQIQLKKSVDSPEQGLLAWLARLGWLALGALGAYASVFALSLWNSASAPVQSLESVVYVETMRSINSDEVSVVLPLSSNTIGLMIAADFDQPGPFTVSISERKTSKLIAELDGVVKTENEDIAVILDGGLFSQGVYQVASTDLSSGKQTQVLIEFVPSPSK